MTFAVYFRPALILLLEFFRIFLVYFGIESEALESHDIAATPLALSHLSCHPVGPLQNLAFHFLSVNLSYHAHCGTLGRRTVGQSSLPAVFALVRYKVCEANK